MTPQEWIEKVAEYEDAAAQTRGIFLGQTVRFAREGAQHLAAALEAVATMSPSCVRCQSAHCCSVRDDSAKTPLCVSDPDGSMPLWMPWTNEDVRARVDPIYAQVDVLREEISRLKAQLSQVHAERVVVPELTEDDLCQQCTTLRPDDGSLSSKMAQNQRFNFVNGYNLAASRAHSVPASRVIKEWETGVDRRLLGRLIEDAHTLVNCARMNGWTESIVEDVADSIVALRAQGKDGAT